MKKLKQPRSNKMKFVVATLLCGLVLGCTAGPIAITGEERPVSRGRKGCRRNYDPVCGSNGVTYSNLCVFQNAQRRAGVDLTLASEGRCPEVAAAADCPEICAASWEPVCGSDGRTYSNVCSLNRARCKIAGLIKAADGACPNTRDKRAASSGCPQFCIRLYAPVCGDDGVTYNNQCELERASCIKNTRIGIAREGRCEEVAVVDCPEICPFSWEPVCGSNGRTYSNLCSLNRARCKIAGLTKTADGACPNTRGKRAASSGCPQFCIRLYAPVCGDDGVTYNNRCELERASCIKNTRIGIAREGRCEDRCDTPCPRIYAPVCGSDGVLYGNECLFQAQRCRDSRLTKGTNCFS